MAHRYLEARFASRLTAAGASLSVAYNASKASTVPNNGNKLLTRFRLAHHCISSTVGVSILGAFFLSSIFVHSPTTPLPSSSLACSSVFVFSITRDVKGPIATTVKAVAMKVYALRVPQAPPSALPVAVAVGA